MNEKEPLKYVAKFTFLSKVVTEKRDPAAPSYKEFSNSVKTLNKVK